MHLLGRLQASDMALQAGTGLQAKLADDQLVTPRSCQAAQHAVALTQVEKS